VLAEAASLCGIADGTADMLSSDMEIGDDGRLRDMTAADAKLTGVSKVPLADDMHSDRQGWCWTTGEDTCPMQLEDDADDGMPVKNVSLSITGAGTTCLPMLGEADSMSFDVAVCCGMLCSGAWGGLWAAGEATCPLCLRTVALETGGNTMRAWLTAVVTGCGVVTDAIVFPGVLAAAT